MQNIFFRVLLIPLLCATAAAQSGPTELRIHPVDESGKSIAVSEAEVYLDVGGGGKTVALPMDEGGVRVPLGREWLCDVYPAGCDDPFAEGRVVLHAAGYAPVASASFLWMGGEETPGSAPQSSVDIAFLNGAWMHVEDGVSKDLTVPFREPVARRLRFLSQAGEPVAGVSVRLSLLLASSNHCGSIEGTLLAEGFSDDAGDLSVPDADAELAFEFTKPHHVLQDPQDAAEPMRFTGSYSGPVTVVLLRKLERRPLHLRLQGAEDVSGLTLSGCIEACACGACCGQIAESDADGRIDLEAFYPEEFERLTLLDRQGRMVWQSTPRTLSADPVIIEIPETLPVLSEPVPLERRR